MGRTLRARHFLETRVRYEAGSASHESSARVRMGHAARLC